MPKSYTIPYTTDYEAVALGLKARGLNYEQRIDRVIKLDDLQLEQAEEPETLYPCTCCPGFNNEHQDHCGIWLNEE